MKKILDIFNGKTDSEGTFQLKFSREENNWCVYNGVDLVYVGDKDKCKRYLKHMQLMQA